MQRKKECEAHAGTERTLEQVLVLFLLIGNFRAVHAIAVSSCLSRVPLHAQVVNNSNTNCTWECENGFFRTSNTCRMCSTYFYYYEYMAKGDYQAIEQLFLCPKGQFLSECARDADAECRPCAQQWSLESGKVYSQPGDCEMIACRDGFAYNHTSKDCQACDKGFYCIEGKNDPYRCPDACTFGTEAGATHILQCKGDTDETTIFSITHVLFMPPSLTFVPATESCRIVIDQQIMSWITLGTFLGCSIQFQSATTTIAIMQCDVSIDACVAGPYIEWLRTLIIHHKPALHSLLQACFHRADLIIGNMIIEPRRTVTQNNNNNNNKELAIQEDSETLKKEYMEKHETLSYEHLSINNKRQAVANALGVVLVGCMIVLALVIVLFIVIGCWTQPRKRALFRFYRTWIRHKA